MYAWIGLKLSLDSKRWGWVDGTPLNYTAWECGGPTNVFNDLSGTALPVAVMSNGGPLRSQPQSCPLQQAAPPPPTGHSTSPSMPTGLWTNNGFSLSTQPGRGAGVAFGRFTSNYSPYGSSPSLACDLTGTTDYSLGKVWNPPLSACIYSAAFTYVCKVPA